MIRTEEEAKHRTCPLTFKVESGPWPCVGSGCMAWRKHDQIGLTPEGKKVDRDVDGRTRWVDRGYCGLAGKPLI